MRIILGVYFVIQVLVLSSLMVLEISLPLHIIMISITCLLYLAVAFKNPGYFQRTEKQHSLSDEIHRGRKYVQGEDGMKEIDEAGEEEQSEGNANSKTYNLGKCGQHKANESQNIYNTKQMKNKSLLPYDQQIKRYCRICRIYQPLRVRHCHECEKCIYTFDHHCPWMDNCIGEKNRVLYWVYLFTQFLQFLFAEISVFKAIAESQEYEHAYFFAVGLTLVMLVSLGLFGWQTFLMLINLTTWQYARWNKIEYLKIYSEGEVHPKKSSPFSRGWSNNIVDYFLSNWLEGPYQWQLKPLKNPRIFKRADRGKKESAKIKEKCKTERVISRNAEQFDQE